MEYKIKDHVFNIRPLTRGEIKLLRKKGFNLANLNPETADECMDLVLEMVLGDTSDLDKLPNPYALELFRKIMDLTYGGEAEKNSLSTGEVTPAAE